MRNSLSTRQTFNLKKLLSTTLVTVLLFTLSSCKTPQHTESTEALAKNNSQTEPTDNLATRLVGAWRSEATRSGSFYILVFYRNGSACYFWVDEESSVGKDKSERNTGTYYIKDDELWVDLYGFFVSREDGFVVSTDGNKLRLVTDLNGKELEIELEKLFFNEHETHSIVGTWKPMYDTETNLRIGNSDYKVKELSFYNDGSYKRRANNNEGYGQYELLFDGEAVQLTESLHSGKINFELIGYGLMLYEYTYYDIVSDKEKSQTYFLTQVEG